MAGGARRALVVGVDRYDDPGLTRLRAPARDVEELAEVLGDPDIGGFEVTRSGNPTEGELSRAVDAFFADARPDDLLLLHLSCHGVKDASGELYFAATDTDLRRLRSTAVASSFVSAALRDSRARRSLLLLDCCYSGAFDVGSTHRGVESVDLEGRFSGSQGRGRAVLTASSAMEYAFEGTALTDAPGLDGGGEGTSVFTSALVHGLRTGEADRDQDGRIDLDELYEYTLDRVRSSTSRQTPHLWVYGLEGRLAVARRKAPVTAPAPLPPEVQAALDNPLASVRGSVVPYLVRLAQGSHLGLALASRLALEELTSDDSRHVEAAARAALAEVGPAPASTVQASASTVQASASTVRASASTVPAPAGTVQDAAAAPPTEHARTSAATGRTSPATTGSPPGAEGRSGHAATSLRAPGTSSPESERSPAPQERRPSAAGDDPPDGSAGRTGTSPRRRPAASAAAAAAAVAVAVGAVLGVWRVLGDGDDRGDQLTAGDAPADAGATSPPASPSPAALPPLEWAGSAAPTATEQALLEVVQGSFADTGSCAGPPPDDPDPRDVLPEGTDNLVCRYRGGTTVVFSRFDSDAAMHAFFDGRLASRGLTERTGELDVDWPWHVRLTDPAAGRAYGNVNLDRPVDDERSEIGMVLDGTATYAYAFEPGDDFASLFEWWAVTFLDWAP